MKSVAHTQKTKPVIGISIGDINGIGAEIILKTLSEPHIHEYCIPLVIGSCQVLNFYKKTIPSFNVPVRPVTLLSEIGHKNISVYECWNEDVEITPGVCNETGGKYALMALEKSVQLLKDKKINVLVTAPVHKKNIYSAKFDFTGHTPFLQHYFNAPEVAMLMVAENMRVALLTEHIPVKNIATCVTKETIWNKIEVLVKSLKRDFLVEHPKIAVLALNPHCGDDGLIGTEDKNIILPAVEHLREKNILAFGPYSADAFFARGWAGKFDAVLAMYHDQGLIPFKSLAIGEGVNFTAGLPVIRTSPDHGTAFDIAGKNKASESSFRTALFTAIDIARNRFAYDEMNASPLERKKVSLFVDSENESADFT